MISKEIEKEIQQENKVFLSFNMRQTICVGIAVVLSILISFVLQWDFVIAMIPSILIGTLCFGFGWVKRDGIPMEQLLYRRLKRYIYKNENRIYKSKNAYVTMLNQEYQKKRVFDQKSKSIRKAIKRQGKLDAKKKKKSKMKAIS